MNEYIDALKNYFNFNGRASRRQYWMFYLFSFLINFVVGFILGFIKALSGKDMTFIINIYFLALLIPSIAISVRRNHDSDKSGWWVLLPFYNLVLLIVKGIEGDNKYGPNPNSPSGTVAK